MYPVVLVDALGSSRLFRTLIVLRSCHVITTLSAACTKLGIVPASNILTRLSSDCLSLRHALLNPASAAALSVGLSANRCIRSLNLGRCAVGHVSFVVTAPQ